MTIFREHIVIRKGSEPDKLLARFKESLLSFQGNREELLFKVEAAIREFVARGEQLAGFDSVVKAKRTIEGKDHFVIVEIDYGRKPGLIARLLGARA